MSDIYMLSEANQRAAGHKQLILVREVCRVIGLHAVKLLLVIHVLSWCDMTSSLYRHGKVSVMKKPKKSPEALQLAGILLLENASKEQVQEAGCKLIAYVYSGHVNSSLTPLHYSAYMNMVSSSTHLPRPERLPPTDSAAAQHSYYVHQQMVQWSSFKTAKLNPVEWGWKLHEDKFMPVALDSAIAHVQARQR
jgi:hypothetical protein